MEYDLIISQFSEHNEIGMMLCTKFKAKTSLILLEEKNKEKFRDLKEVYRELLPECNVTDIFIKTDNIASITDLFIKYKNNKILINLTGGEEITSLILLKKSLELNIESTYVDLFNMKRYAFGDEIEIIEEDLQDLKISDITRFAGADIINDSSELASKKDIIMLTKLISNNLDIWHRNKRKLYDNSIFIHNYMNSSKIIVNKKRLKIQEQEILMKILTYIKGLGGLEYRIEEDKVHVEFKNDYLKGFIFKSGTWLEVLTKMVIQDIKEIDEVKSGVEFFWSNDSQRVKNEIDVVAISDSILICVSCKDSEKYDEDALNELEVYSNKIGGEDVVKILVATKLPLKTTIMDRAREMNINIVVLNNNIEKFKEELINIIKNKED